MVSDVEADKCQAHHGCWKQAPTLPRKCQTHQRTRQPGANRDRLHGPLRV